MQDPANELPRIHLPRTWVYKGKKKSRITGLRCYPVAWTSTTQSAEAELGGVPRLRLSPPLIVWVAPSNAPVRGLYQLFWKLPETPLRSKDPVEVASGHPCLKVSNRVMYI
jgi:hypothetical protein